MLFVPRTVAPQAKHAMRHLGTLWLLGFVLIWTALLTGCGGDSEDHEQTTSEQTSVQAPAGLSYGMPAAVYETGLSIPANRPTISGSPVDRYSVDPALPAGLVLDAGTGVISGTPTEASGAALYVVTAQNSAGSTTARLQIEVRSKPALPAGLAYRETAAIYTVNEAISRNAPTNTGGPIASYSIAPALPAGLVFDTLAGVISGTPTAVTAQTAYTITGANAAGSVTTTITIAVQAAPVPPASLAYSSPVATYVTAESIVPNTPSVTGGNAKHFEVAPTLPAGLSLNTETGVIAGTATATQSEITYTVTASNDAGSVQTQLRIAVTAHGDWTPASDVFTPSAYHAAALLPDGRVLLTGGTVGGGVASNDAEVYDPVANTWTATASMNVARYNHTLTVLPDGRILAVGGQTSFAATTDTVEAYDPVSGTWQLLPSMQERRNDQSATLLPDGRVLVIGGYAFGSGYSDSAEAFDPVTNSWTMWSTHLHDARSRHAAQLLVERNAIMIVGGSSGVFPMQTEYFPLDDNGSTSAVAAYPPISFFTQSVRLANGKVLVQEQDNTSTWLYDPDLDTWTSTPLGSFRSRASMTLLNDGRVLLAGGSTTGGPMSDTVLLYDPASGLWTSTGNMSTARGAHAAVRLTDGRVLVMSGNTTYNGSVYVPGAEIYLP